jgi:hypothetical protein
MKIPYWSFVKSVLGSVTISLSAPLLAGISIAKNHPNANRWVLIQRWLTRLRATMFVAFFNLWAAHTSHKEMLRPGTTLAGPQQADGHLETAATALAAEFFVLLRNQVSVGSDEYSLKKRLSIEHALYDPRWSIAIWQSE